MNSLLELSCIDPQILLPHANTKNSTDEYYLRGRRYFENLNLGYISNPPDDPYFNIHLHLHPRACPIPLPHHGESWL